MSINSSAAGANLFKIKVNNITVKKDHNWILQCGHAYVKNNKLSIRFKLTCIYINCIILRLGNEVIYQIHDLQIVL